MKVYVIHYFVEDGEAGISAIFADRAKAKEHFAACVRGTFEGSDETPEEVDAAVAKALEKKFHDYPGSGSGARPWYELSVSVVRK
jgi:hypothetical protein